MELKEILDFTGIKADSIEDFKTNFESTFIKKDLAAKDPDIISRTTGKRINELTQKIKPVLQKHGIDLFTVEDFKTKSLDEIIEQGMEHYSAATSATIKELEGKASQNGNEQVKEWQDKYSKLEGKYKDTDKALKEVSTEFTGYKTNAANQIKGIKIKTVTDAALNSFPKRQDLKEIELKGFQALINEKYKIDLDEEDKPFIATKEKGERIRNPERANEFLTVEDVLKKEAQDAGIVPKNPHYVPPRVPQAAIPVSNGQQNNVRPMATRK